MTTHTKYYGWRRKEEASEKADVRRQMWIASDAASHQREREREGAVRERESLCCIT
jgi:hypothetical protein